MALLGSACCLINKTSKAAQAGTIRMATEAGLEPVPFIVLAVSQCSHNIQMLIGVAPTEPAIAHGADVGEPGSVNRA